MWYYAFYAGLTATLGALAFQFIRLIVMAVARRTVAASSAGNVTLTAPGEAPAWAGRLATFLTWVAVASLTLTRRGLGARSTPRYAAPASIPATASAARVIPQNLTLGGTGLPRHAGQPPHRVGAVQSEL